VNFFTYPMVAAKVSEKDVVIFGGVIRHPKLQKRK
jgi:hypothetical protein